MTTPRRTALLLVAILTTACSSPTTSEPVSTPVVPPGPGPEALAVYERYWSVSDAAFASPGSRDWKPELATVASGRALESLLRDVLNYADFPAHTEGAISRAPTVTDVTNNRVQILDCVDLGDSRLIADRTGQVLDDLTHRVQRYRFRAQLVETSGRWLVDQTDPAQDEPC